MADVSMVKKSRCVAIFSIVACLLFIGFNSQLLAQGEQQSLSEQNAVAESLLDKGDYVNAYKRAFNVREEAIYQNDQKQLAKAVWTIGISFYYLSDLKAALDYYEQAFTIYQSTYDIPSQAHILSNISSVYSELHDFDTAIEFDMRAIELVRDTEFEDEFLWLRLNLAYDLGRNKEYENSIHQYLILMDRLNDSPNYLNYLYRQLSEIYRRSGQLEQANTTIQKAIKLATDNQSDELLYGSLLEQAEVLLELQQVDEAIQKTQKALGHFNEAKRKSLVAQAYNILYRANEQLGRYQDAIKAFRIQKQIEDELQSIKMQQYSQVFAIEKQVKEQKDAIRAIQVQKDKLIQHNQTTIELYSIIIAALAFLNIVLILTSFYLYKKSRK